MRKLVVEYARAHRWNALTDKRSLVLHPEQGRRIDEIRACARVQSGVNVTFGDVVRALLDYALSGVTDETKVQVEK